jgi:hypothetical protein
VNTVAPLVGQGLAVDQDESGCGARFDCSACDYGLACAGRCNQDASVFDNKLVQCCGLCSAQCGGAAEVVVCTELALVVDAQCALGGVDEFGQQSMQAPGQYEVTVDGFVVTVEETRCVPGASSGTLARIEFRVTYRGGMFDGRDHRWAKIIGGQGDPRRKRGTDNRRRAGDNPG